MNINIEGYNSVAAFLPGLYKFAPDALFMQASLAVTDDALLIYNDHAPDQKINDVLTYKIQAKIPFTDIDTIVNELIINNKDIEGLGRLNILLEKGKGNLYFYYFIDDKKPLKFFLDILKRNGFRVSSRKVDLAKE